MKKLIVYISICFGLLYTSNAQSVVIQQKIDSLVAAQLIPGIIIGTINKGEQSFYTAGWANVEKKQKFSANTQLEIGSITKTFTAFIVESVLRNKGIADTVFILSYLPDSVKANKGLAAIRFIHLLNHTAGFPRLPSNLHVSVNMPQPYQGYNRSKLYSYLVSAKVQPIGNVDYSNLGMGLAGDLAEIISGKSYSQLLEQYISKPFQLKETALSANEQLPKSTGYFKKEQPAFYWNMEALVGAGAIKSTAADMLQYADFILQHQRDPLIKDLLISTATINPLLNIGKGWHIFSQPNTLPIVWHNGGTYGFSTFIALNTTTHQAVFLVVNAFNKNNITDVLGIEILTKILSTN